MAPFLVRVGALLVRVGARIFTQARAKDPKHPRPRPRDALLVNEDRSLSRVAAPIDCRERPKA
jgi:hypothetical protein